MRGDRIGESASASACRVASASRLRTCERIWRCACILALLLVLVVDGLFDELEPVVDTKWGKLRGKWSRSLRDRPIANFLGIPYALPPVGDLRFKSPQRWNRTWTIRDATVDGEKCLQTDFNFNVFGSEDCLYLNIFVPLVTRNQSSTAAKLPVLVYLHGGGYVYGSSDSKLYAPDYLMDQDLILVTLNYRLNVLGFFSTTNRASPGNYGLKDALMALKWIRENVHSFEGNPESVTVMGTSAGSAAVHLLALSNKTEGLFDKYILHSGSALSPWNVHPRKAFRRTGLKLARLVGCLPRGHDGANNASNETTLAENREEGNGTGGGVYDDDAHDNEDYSAERDEEMMKCMRTVDAVEMLKMTRFYNVWRWKPVCVFGPTLEDDSSEDAILTMHPMRVMKEGLSRDIPAIIQVVKDEGLTETLGFFTDLDVEQEMIENFERYLPYFLECRDIISNTSIFTAAIEDYYFNGNVSLGLKHNITEMAGDFFIAWPVFQTVRYQSEVGNSSIYFSLFAYEGTFTFTFASGIPIHYGVSHMDDMNYLFPIFNNIYAKQLMLHNTENDLTMINIMTEMWANFVKTGVPKAWTIPAWPDYRDHQEFMRFGNGRSPDIAVQADFLSGRMEFWEKLMPIVSAESVIHDDPLAEMMLENDAGTTDGRSTVRLALLSLIVLLYAQ